MQRRRVVETMRREGFELLVSVRPSSTKKGENGERLEPYEDRCVGGP